MRHLRLPFALACVVLLHPRPASAEVLHVNVAAEGGDGSSWALAMTDLQDALAAAQPGDEIWVAAGTYTPSTTDAAASFVLASGVGLYGGFAGDETSLEQRDWTARETMLSGDIGGDDVLGSWPSGWDITTSNSGHVVVANGTDRSAIVDGFTIAQGHTGPPGTPAGHELMFGSGLYAIGGSPTIRHCTFEHNLAAFAMGGGVYCFNGDPRFEDCTFRQNYVHGGGGGGMFVGGTSDPIVHDCTFVGNISVAISVSNLDGDGAGIALYSSHRVTVERCRFEDNLAKSFYGIGDEIGYGGGLWSWDAGVTVRDCSFIDNTAAYGAGVMAWGPATIVNCAFLDNTAVPHPDDPYPELGGDGAGVCAESAGADRVQIVNCVLAYNHGKKYVGAAALWNAVLDVHNSIIRENDATHPETAGTWKEQVAGFDEIAYCNISHIFEPHGPGEDPIDPADLPGVVDADPHFVDPSALGDLHLGAGSPCIDAGRNDLVPADTVLDLDGHARFADDPDVADTGFGTAPIVDMGPYEHGSAATVPGDVDGDGAVGVADLLAVLSAWGACPGCAADLDGDGAVGVSDLLVVLANWS